MRQMRPRKQQAFGMAAEEAAITPRNPKLREHAQCDLCQFWVGASDGKGECRSRPPVWIKDGCAWPITAHNDWCASFRS